MMAIRRRKSLLVEKWRRRLKGCCSSGRAAIPVWYALLHYYQCRNDESYLCVYIYMCEYNR